MKLISYVFPIYNEEGNIDLLYDTMNQVTASLPYDIEFIFINDGSRDRSLELLRGLAERDARVRVLNLSRNYGHQLAVTAGLDAARGDALIIMDSDLQDPPEVSLELIKEWENGFDVVYAQRRSREDTAFKKLTADVYYRLLASLSSIDIPRNTGDFRLISRRVADDLKRYREHDRFLRGMVADIGYKQKAVQFDRHARHAGETGYPLSKMIRFAADGIMGFSSKPLQLITSSGYAIAALALIGIFYVLFRKIFFPAEVVSGWAFVTIVILFLGGLQLIMMGIIGSYVGRIYTEVKGRPLYLVADEFSQTSRASTEVPGAAPTTLAQVEAEARAEAAPQASGLKAEQPE